MDKIEYVRCPRCELNYIDKREKMCKVCEAELNSKGNKELTDDEIKELNLCPVCRTNYLMDDEEICAECAAEKAAIENNESFVAGGDQLDEKDDRDDNWRAYVENDDAEVPEDEYGDMSSITTGDEDILDDDDLADMEKDEDFEDEFDDESESDDFDDFENDFDDDFDEVEDYDDEEYDDDDVDNDEDDDE